MHLIKSHDYLMKRLQTPNVGQLRMELQARPADAKGLLAFKALVVADSARGMKFLAPEQIVGLSTTNANNTIAFSRGGTNKSVADYYRDRREPLLYPHLPLLTVGLTGELHREFFPLEKVYLHECGRPCKCHPMSVAARSPAVQLFMPEPTQPVQLRFENEESGNPNSTNGQRRVSFRDLGRDNVALLDSSEDEPLYLHEFLGRDIHESDLEDEILGLADRTNRKSGGT